MNVIRVCVFLNQVQVRFKAVEIYHQNCWIVFCEGAVEEHDTVQKLIKFETYNDRPLFIKVKITCGHYLQCSENNMWSETFSDS